MFDESRSMCTAHVICTVKLLFLPNISSVYIQPPVIHIFCSDVFPGISAHKQHDLTWWAPSKTISKLNISKPCTLLFACFNEFYVAYLAFVGIISHGVTRQFYCIISAWDMHVCWVYLLKSYLTATEIGLWFVTFIRIENNLWRLKEIHYST